MIKQFCLNTFKTSLDKLSKNVFTYLQANGFYKSFIEAFASSHAKDITTEKKPEFSGTKAQQYLEQPTRNTLTFRPLLKQRMHNLPNIKLFSTYRHTLLRIRKRCSQSILKPITKFKQNFEII